MLNYWNLYLACKQQQLYAGPLIIGTFEKRAPGAKKTLRLNVLLFGGQKLF